MDITQYLPWLTLALTIIVGAFAWWRTRPGSVASVVDIISDAAYTARTLVAAAEQLASTGKLPTNDDKLDFALLELSKLYPALDGDQLRLTIEAAVYWLKQARPLVKASDGTAQPLGAQGLPVRKAGK
jgi:hypothetical protein